MMSTTKTLYLSSLLAVGAILSLGSCRQTIPGDDDKKNEENGQIELLLKEAGTLSNPTGQTREQPRTGSKRVEDAPGYTDPNWGDMPFNKVTETIDCDFFATSDQFALLDPWASVIWPGCLIQGGSVRGYNVPTAIPITSKRKPGRITLQIVSGAPETGEETWYEDCAMRASDVLQAQNKLLKKFMKSGAAASTSYAIKVIHSKEDLKAKIGTNIKAFGGSVDAAFGSAWDKTKNYCLVTLYQRFFTMAYDDPEGYRGVFTPEITADDLRPYTGAGNPICFVSSVSYGRVFYLLYESSETAKTLETSLGLVFKQFNLNNTLNYNKVVKESRVKMLQYGGDPQAGLAAGVSADPEKIKQFMEGGARFGLNNVGAPISFTIKNLYDNSIATMPTTLKYSYDKTEYVPKTLNNTVGIELKDVVVSTEGKGKYKVSNLAYAQVKSARVRFYDKAGKYVSGDELAQNAPAANIINPAYFSIYRGISKECRKDVTKIEIRWDVYIHAESWKSGSRNKAGGMVTMVQTFRYANGQWRADPLDSQVMGSAFSNLTKTQDIGNLSCTVRANFNFLVENRLIRGSN